MRTRSLGSTWRAVYTSSVSHGGQGRLVCCAEEPYPGMPETRPPGAALGTPGGLQ